MNNSRSFFIDFAKSFSGAGASGERASEYKNLLTRGGFEPAQVQMDMMKMSSCALFIRSLWWFFGLDHPLYEKPYRSGLAVVDVLKIAKDNGAYIPGWTLSASRYPRAGDVFYLSQDSGKQEHFGLIINEVRATPCLWTYETVEGGQGVGGRFIETLSRTLGKSRGVYGSIGNRLMAAWIDFDRLHLPGLREGLSSSSASPSSC